MMAWASPIYLNLRVGVSGFDVWPEEGTVIEAHAGPGIDQAPVDASG